MLYDDKYWYEFSILTNDDDPCGNCNTGERKRLYSYSFTKEGEAVGQILNAMRSGDLLKLLKLDFIQRTYFQYDVLQSIMNAFVEEQLNSGSQIWTMNVGRLLVSFKLSVCCGLSYQLTISKNAKDLVLLTYNLDAPDAEQIIDSIKRKDPTRLLALFKKENCGVTDGEFRRILKLELELL